MKKVLAVLLAAIMAFTVGVSAFAVEMPDFPKQESNMVYLAAESMYVEAGGTYTVPVYVVSNYGTFDEGATGTVNYAFGYEVAGSGAGYATVTAAPAEGVTEGILGGYEADLTSLNQEKMALVNLTVTVAEDFPGDQSEIIINITTPIVTVSVDGKLPTIIPEGELGTVSSHLYEKPHWTVILHDWVNETKLTIVNFFLLIFQFLQGIL